MEFWGEQPVMMSHLDNIRKTMDAAVPSEGRFAVISRELLTNPGKLLRPALLILTAGFDQAGGDPYHLGAALEYLHLASLVHDDIIDHARERRGAPSVVGEHGVQMALYTGDYLIFLAARCLAAADRSQLKEDSLDFMGRLLEAEARQLDERFALELDQEDYLQRIEAKTGLLFSLAAGAGHGLSQGFAKDIEAAKQAGLHFGTAFQLRDDLLDLEDPAHGDLTEGNYTLPVLLASRQDPALKELLLKPPGQTKGAGARDFEEIKQRISRSDAIHLTRQVLDQYLDRAGRTFDQLMGPQEAAVYRWMENKLFGGDR